MVGTFSSHAVYTFWPGCKHSNAKYMELVKLALWLGCNPHYQNAVDLPLDLWKIIIVFWSP